ncbi:hypothetical protein [Marinobacter subterrani]|uniref:type IVB secretion system protein IcmW n=1 Tax=Marinobacter subterrani TaxID=1658765 RepID=UPI002355224B|nr:hypothetical protein [Marinobacter subterrani]
MDYLLQNSAATSPVTGVGGAHTYWKAVDQAASDVAQMLDEKETWVLEAHPEFREKLDNLIIALRDNPGTANYCLSNPRESLKLMAWLHTSTAMMLLHYAEHDRRELVVRFLEVVTSILATEKATSEVYKASSLAVERFLVFERSALIQRVFSADRVHRILAALEQVAKFSHHNEPSREI